MTGSHVQRAADHETPTRDIVCVYAHHDEPFYRSLQTSLSLWQREGYIRWLEVAVGSDVEQTLHVHLRQAHLLLLLISPDFFEQDRSYRAMHIALQERVRRQVPVVPVLVRASAWKESACGSLDALPTGERPLAEWPHPEQAYEEIRVGLARLLSGEGDWRQHMLQGGVRGHVDPAAPRQGQETQPAIVQSGALHIGKISSNRGHIGHIYGDVRRRD